MASRQLAAQLGQGLTALVVGFGVNQVGDRLGLGEIQASALEGPTSEFPRLGWDQSQVPQRLAHPLDHSGAPVQMQLGAIFAREARRGGKPKHQGFIKDSAVGWIAQMSEARPPRPGQGAAERP